MASFGELSAVASSILASKIFGTVCDTLLKNDVFPLVEFQGHAPTNWHISGMLPSAAPGSQTPNDCYGFAAIWCFTRERPLMSKRRFHLMMAPGVRPYSFNVGTAAYNVLKVLA